MRIYKHRGAIAFGVGGETVGIYDDQTDESYRVLHIKVDFWCWHAHFDIQISRRTKHDK